MGRTNKGFTLIELLVVIAIIAILAAILFPVFMSARSKARSASCQTYLKQLGVGLLNYMTDYNDTFPDYRNYGDLTWNRIVAYTKSKKMHVCPDAVKPVISQIDAFGGDHLCWRYTSKNGVQYGSYCLNGWLHYDYPKGLWIIKMSQITSPSKTMAIADGRWVDTWASNLLDPETPGDYSFTWRIAVKRHSDGINMVFMGGNVSWIPIRGLAVADKSKRRVIYNPITDD